VGFFGWVGPIFIAMSHRCVWLDVEKDFGIGILRAEDTRFVHQDHNFRVDVHWSEMVNYLALLHSTVREVLLKEWLRWESCEGLRCF